MLYIIKEVLSIIGDICLFAIAVYTFYLTIYPKKLKFIAFRLCGRSYEGDSIEITFENRSLSPISVQSVTIVANNKYLITVCGGGDDEACIIEAFKTAKIKMEPYSTILTDDDEKPDLHTAKSIYLIVKTSRGTQYLNFSNGPKAPFLKQKTKRNSQLQIASVSREYYYGKIIKPDIRFALSYFDSNHVQQIVFIDKFGHMSEAPFGYNGLPKELIGDEAQLRAHFDKEFNAAGIPYLLEKVSLMWVKQDISAEQSQTCPLPKDGL